MIIISEGNLTCIHDIDYTMWGQEDEYDIKCRKCDRKCKIEFMKEFGSNDSWKEADKN